MEQAPPDVVETVSVSVEPDAALALSSQVVMSRAEAETMQRMPGGICFTNWLRIRGLLAEWTRES